MKRYLPNQVFYNEFCLSSIFCCIIGSFGTHVHAFSIHGDICFGLKIWYCHPRNLSFGFSWLIIVLNGFYAFGWVAICDWERNPSEYSKPKLKFSKWFPCDRLIGSQVLYLSWCSQYIHSKKTEFRFNFLEVMSIYNFVQKW